MKIREVTFALKKGQPNYGSLSAGITIEIEEGDNVQAVWDKARQEVEKNCTMEPSWMNQSQVNEKQKTESLPF